MYRLIRAFLFFLDAETAHHVAFFALRLFFAIPGAKWLRPRSDPALAVRALGTTFPNPIGLAAGFDKDAKGYDALLALGFGFVEVGTITAQPQPGNPRPRLFRLPSDRALINRMGFNNKGAKSARKRVLSDRLGVVGVNLGKTKKVPEHGAVADYVASASELGPCADYVVVNVSSPNTPNLRDLQAPRKLAPILHAVRHTLDRVSPHRRVPLLVKIAPDLADEDLDAIAALALAIGLDGIIATNTTIQREALRTSSEAVHAIGAGGLSGAPLRDRSLAVLRRLRRAVGDKITLISAGGIETAEDVFVRICAGASLVQVYTGFVYGGPRFPSRLARDLTEKLRAAGYASVMDAVGSGSSRDTSSI